jgi:hypothetical protein
VLCFIFIKIAVQHERGPRKLKTKIFQQNGIINQSENEHRNLFLNQISYDFGHQQQQQQQQRLVDSLNNPLLSLNSLNFTKFLHLSNNNNNSTQLSLGSSATGSLFQHTNTNPFLSLTNNSIKLKTESFQQFNNNNNNNNSFSFNSSPPLSVSTPTSVSPFINNTNEHYPSSYSPDSNKEKYKYHKKGSSEEYQFQTTAQVDNALAERQDLIYKMIYTYLMTAAAAASTNSSITNSSSS